MTVFLYKLNVTGGRGGGQPVLHIVLVGNSSAVYNDSCLPFIDSADYNSYMLWF